MEFTNDELIVLRQLFQQWELTNGRTVEEEILNIDTAPYVVGFKPEPGQTRLPRSDWAAFVKKLKEIAKPPAEHHHDIGGEG